MIKIANIKSVLLVWLMLFPAVSGLPCSMYKITLNGKTMIGCNEDAWRTTPHIWFETAKKPGQYGAAFTGSRWDGGNGYAPQSGMNEMGLAYSRLASSFPEYKQVFGKKAIDNPTMYLKDILHSCKNVDQVRAYISQYDHSFFFTDVMIYIEKSGRYLIVEPYTLTIGNDANYVLSNFCPSVTSETDALKMDRYRKGVEFLKAQTDTSLEFCAGMSNAMHVCRDKIGDGTLLTSIWNSQDGIVNLYFYHQYQKTVQYNIHDELAKGDHIIALEQLFPANAEFEKLRNFKTPQNTVYLMVFLLCCGLLFFFSAWFFLVAYLRKRSKFNYSYALIAMFPLGLALFYYMYVLCRTHGVFYFPSPYEDPQNDFVSWASYLPFVLLALILPMFWISYNLFKEKGWSLVSRWLFALNNGIFMLLLVLFGYWGLLSFWH